MLWIGGSGFEALLLGRCEATLYQTTNPNQKWELKWNWGTPPPPAKPKVEEIPAPRESREDGTAPTEHAASWEMGDSLTKLGVFVLPSASRQATRVGTHRK